MSFDLVVWPAQGPVPFAEAAARYAELRAEADVPTHPAVAAFLRELTQTCPDPDDGTPWSSALTVAREAVIVHVVWREHRRVRDLVRLLAERHGLTCFDPTEVLSQ